MGDRDAIAAYAQHFGRPIEQVAADLESYAKLIRKWQQVQNLVSRETLGVSVIKSRLLLSSL